MSGRPGSAMRGRPPTGSFGRPPSSMRAGPPGTGRPGTRSGQAPVGNSVFGSGIKVADRPMTQQGLGGMKTASKGQRQIQDRTFWVGEVRSKCTEISAEIRKIESKIVQHQEENNTFLMFEKRAETLAAEIAEIQGELHDYNMLVDRINMNQEISDMVEDLDAIKVRNDQEADSLERIFEHKETKEKQIAELEKEIHRQQALTENRVQDMKPEMQEKYSKLKQDSFQTLDKLGKLQEILEGLNGKQQSLELEMQSDIIKQDAVKLYEKLNELNQKEEQLLEEERTRVSPEEEQRQLLASVKSHNQEISTMDRQNKELEEKIKVMQEELQQLQSELEDQQSETTDKFRQLQKREQTIDEFTKAFDDTKQQEMQQQNNVEESIVVLLEQISKMLEYGEHVPSSDKMRALKDDLQFKEDELQKAESTSTSLAGHSSQLQQELAKVESLESNIDSEKIALANDIQRMESEIEEYGKIDEMRDRIEKRKTDLDVEKEDLEKRKVKSYNLVQKVTTNYEDLNRNLEENDAFARLQNLEKRWQSLEQNNFSLKEYIASNSVDCELLKGEVMKNVSETNRLLQDLYTKSSLLT
ncbi:intraflagellar transport protein 74 homolog [Clavelina lepadiformis]|uniref:Uncharacterized protein n=1 Tax=Clavelina lepadiformis TaxID=159417 RepID=A0ABP0FA19_CLALP